MDRKTVFLHVLMQLWPSHTFTRGLFGWSTFLRTVFAFSLSLDAIISQQINNTSKKGGGPQIKVLPIQSSSDIFCEILIVFKCAPRTWFLIFKKTLQSSTTDLLLDDHVIQASFVFCLCISYMESSLSFFLKLDLLYIFSKFLQQN